MRSTILLCIGLIVITFSVYLQVMDHEFLNFDDDVYITENAHVVTGLNGPNIVWAFTSVHSFNWHPITWLSHMADAQMYGMNPSGHHLTNVILHVLSSLLLFLLLLRSTRFQWQSAFVAALFALHPLHVESVAWVAERKDVLSAFFCFFTLFFYAEYVAKRKTRSYIIALASFMLGLMSKPMLVTLPIVMLLMDFWPFNRYRLSEQESDQRQRVETLKQFVPLIKEKVPFFVCSILSAVVTIYAQHKDGAIKSFDVMPLGMRIENATVAYAKYIYLMFWPHDLAVLYPFPTSIPLWQFCFSLLCLFLVTVTTILVRRNHPYLIVGWFWFLVTLLPVIGLVQVGSQSMADRYTYIPLIGLFIMVAWGIPFLTRNLKYRRSILALLAGLVLSVLTVLTWKQLDYWGNNVSLYRHAVDVTVNNAIIHNNLGAALVKNGYLDAAIIEYQKALRINPSYVDAHNNLGTAFAQKGYPDSAILEYTDVLKIDPYNISALYNLGTVYAQKGKLDEAIISFQNALKLNPNHADANYNLNVVLTRKNKLSKSQ